MGRWSIVRVDDVHVVTMTSNKVNAMNDDFFGDMEAALDELHRADALPVAVDRDATMGVNEVPVGIPFPAVPRAVMRHALSPAHAREVLLFGRLYAPAKALARGLVDEVVPPDDVIARAVAVARTVPPDSLAAYATLKTHPLAPTLDAYAATREQVNREFLDVWFSEGGRRRVGEVRDRLLRRS